MRITAKNAVTNRVRLRTIITYDFMLYGSRRFRGRISRSASLTASTKTRLEIVAHFRNLERLTRFLLHQMTMLENQRAPGPPAATSAKRAELLKFARNGVFCLRRQYILGTP